MLATPEAPRSVPGSKRRRFRISLRGLMVLVLVLGGGLGWVVHQARVQRDAVAVIERTRGRIGYNWQQRPDGEFDPQGKPPAPKWLVDRLGPDYFGHVVWVILGKQAGDAEMAHVLRLHRLKIFVDNGSGVTDAQALRLGNMTHLETIDLHGPKHLTGATLAGMSRLSRLKVLRVGGIPLHDDDLAGIAGLTGLQILVLPSPTITDAGLIHLQGLVGLQTLFLSGNPITDSGLVNFRGMARLKHLRIDRTRVADLKPLMGLTKLQYLNLGDAPITDGGLAPVAELVDLEELVLDRTAITDAGLSPLRKLSKLDVLHLIQTRITDVGLAALGENPPIGMIDLWGTAVTGAGVDLLEKWSKLRLLHVSGNSLPSDRLDSLGKSRPGLVIQR